MQGNPHPSSLKNDFCLTDSFENTIPGCHAYQHVHLSLPLPTQLSKNASVLILNKME
jgi:hypothetical protein